MIDKRVISKYLTKALVTEDFKKLEYLLEYIYSHDDKSLANYIIEYAERNSLAHLFHKILDEKKFVNNELTRSLNFKARFIYEYRNYFNELLQRLVEILDREGFEYIIFKTFNNLDVIDVDIDIIIHPESYWDVVKTFLNRGFKPIDDLEKTYATGFVYEKNPIIIDLHTEITVLGVPYVSRETLFKHKVKTRYKALNGDFIDIYVLDDIAEALVRIAHAIIKEAEIKIEDMSMVYKAVKESPDELLKLIRAEELIPALTCFMRNVEDVFEARFKSLNEDEENILWTLSCPKSEKSYMPPYRLSRTISIVTLFHRVYKRNELHILLKAIGNLKYRRNVAHIGSLLLKNF